MAGLMLGIWVQFIEWTQESAEYGMNGKTTPLNSEHRT